MTKEFDAKNAAKSRAKCAEMAEAANTGKRVLTEREREILDMWPKFEDGEYVMPGDEWLYLGNPAKENTVSYVTLDGCGAILCSDIREQSFVFGERVKRPVQSVLDADGVEIKVGDSMYVANNGDGPYTVCNIDESVDRIELFWHENRNERLFIPADRLTHTRPDSWERLEEDAADLDDMPCDFNAKDLIRRAKALAGIEVDK